MIHPDTYTGTTDKGVSLFAKRRFKKGEIIWIADSADTILPAATYRSFSEQKKQNVNSLGYLDSKGRFVIPNDNGKYVNHSCSPNCTYLLEYDNISVAMRDIGAGEEITENYRCYYGHLENFDCQCGVPSCSGKLKGDDSFLPSLRLRLNTIAPFILQHRQPLLNIRFEDRKDFLAALNKHNYGHFKSQNLFARMGSRLSLELAFPAAAH